MNTPGTQNWPQRYFFIFIFPAWMFYVGAQYQSTKEILKAAEQYNTSLQSNGDTVKYEMRTATKDVTLPHITDFYNREVMDKVDQQLDRASW
jgi:hypothetical protein